MSWLARSDWPARVLTRGTEGSECSIVLSRTHACFFVISVVCACLVDGSSMRGHLNFLRPEHNLALSVADKVAPSIWHL